MKVSLTGALARITDHWAPQQVATCNGNEVMVVKVRGAFPFHVHEDADDFFLILKGEVLIDIEGEATQVCGPGDLCVIPAGRRHRPRAAKEAEILLIEPLGLRASNDGDRIAARAK